jgi:hypothetical protein
MAIDIRKWLENRFADYEVVGEQPGTYGRVFSYQPGATAYTQRHLRSKRSILVTHELPQTQQS